MSSTKSDSIHSVIAAFDPPSNFSGGGKRTFNMLKSLSKIGSSDIFIFCPKVNFNFQDINIDESNQVSFSIIDFYRSSGNRILDKILQFGYILIPFVLKTEKLILLTDYYVMNQPVSASWFQSFFHKNIRNSLLRESNKRYKAGYSFPARTLERFFQFQELKNEFYDKLGTSNLVWIDFSYCLNFFNIPVLKSNNRLIYCNTHNLEYRYLEILANTKKDKQTRKWLLLQAGLMKKIEIDGFKKCDFVFVCSTVEKNILEEEFGLTNVRLLPNGVDTDYFKSNLKKRSSKNILFTGTMKYQATRDAVYYFVEKIFPIVKSRIHDCKFIIAGLDAQESFSCYNHREDIVIHDSPEDIRGCFEESMIAVVPLLAGGGTRLKILEAAAMELPVVSTSIGAEGLDFINGEEILISDNPNQFADNIIHLLTDIHLYEKVRKSALKKVHLTYSWDKINKDLQEFIKNDFQYLN